MLNRFLDYIEIRTKITSIFPFLMVLGYLYYLKQPVHWGLTGVFFASMFLFDLTTTAINNYLDSRTNGQSLPFSRKTALVIIIALLSASTALGIYLACLTDIAVLLLGGLCFLCGVLYTAGPVPLSRQPLGELASGFFYGLMLPFILLYVNLPAGSLLAVGFSAADVSINIAVWPVFSLLLLSVAPACVTANIMLANNICDVKKDIEVRRYTLPYYLGKKALYLFAGLYYMTYLAQIVLVILRILPAVSLLFLPTIIPVQKNINRFFQKQEKSSTFQVSIQNFLVIMGAQIVLLFLCGLI